MPASPALRDGKIAAQISETEGRVQGLVTLLERLAEHAQANDAEGHFHLYDHVLGSLVTAQKQLQRAHEVMLNGDPEDYLDA